VEYQGVVYPSECVLHCVLERGLCREKALCECPCDNHCQPVCGDDGVTYQNSCFAECVGVTKYSPGACPGTVPPCE